MVNTKKFSEFAAASLTTTTKKMAGISNTSGGENIIVDFTVEWTTVTRPAPPYDGLLGYNTDLKQYEYYDSAAVAWIQLADNAVFTDAKFILQQPHASLTSAQSLSVLTTGILKSTTTTGVLSISAPLTSIDGLTTSADKMIYTTASNVYAVTDLTAFARTLLDDTSAAAVRTTLGLGQAAVKNVTDNAKANVASVTGAFTINHVLLAADANGTVKDGGSPAGMGTVLEVDTGTGLTGGPITTTGTISFDSIAANSLWVNNTAGAAVPAVTSLSALTKTDDTNVTLTLGGTPLTALINAVSLTLGWTGQLSLARGGTNANLTASNGGIVYSTATAMAILAGTATASLPLLSGSSTAPAWGAFALSLGGALTTAGALTTVGAFGATFTFTNTTSVTFPTSGTLATTADIPSLPLSPTNGGTGVSNPTAHGIMVAEGASAMTPILLASGQILIGSTGIDPVAAAINSGSGILVANGAGSITVNLAAIADHTLLANISGGALAPSSTTLTALIDNAIGSTQGNILYRNATVWTVLAPGTSGQHLSTGGAAANPAWTTATFPSTGGTSGNILISNGTNYIASTSLWPNTVGTIGKILRSDGTTNAYSTSTFADTYAASTLLYSNGANTVTGLATANSSVLVTTSAGVPVQSGTMTNGQLIIGSTGATPAVASLTPGTGISITPGAGSISIATTGAVVTPAALSKGDDTNVTLTLTGTPSTALLQATTITAGWTGQLGLTRGGTAASLTASNGGIVYSTSSALAILNGTATAGLALLSGASTTPTWSSSPPITQINVQTITANGTYTPTTGTKYGLFECIGAGGGGGGAAAATAAQSAYGAGGGAGGYATRLFTSAEIGASATATVSSSGGAGGTGAAAGTTGGNTSIALTGTGTVTMTANGGVGGATQASTAAATNAQGAAGGTTTNGSTGSNAGGYGGTAFSLAAGALSTGGQGASSRYGGAGAGGSAASNAGVAATGFGAGGGGAATINGAGAANGGAGSPGLIRVTEYISV